MIQLTVKDLKTALEMFDDNMPIYLGNDEELNGVHEAYFIQLEDAKTLKQLSYNDCDKDGILIS